VVLEFELRDYTLSHSTSSPTPSFCDGFFKIGFLKLFARVVFSDLPDLCLLNS
jgi:hypothetical protein